MDMDFRAVPQYSIIVLNLQFDATPKNLLSEYYVSRVVRKQKNCFQHDMSRIMRKPTFCVCENKDTDQLRGKIT